MQTLVNPAKELQASVLAKVDEYVTDPRCHAVLCALLVRVPEWSSATRLALLSGLARHDVFASLTDLRLAGLVDEEVRPTHRTRSGVFSDWKIRATTPDELADHLASARWPIWTPHHNPFTTTAAGPLAITYADDTEAV